MRKIIVGVVSAIAGAAMMAGPANAAAHGECGEVTITEMNWASAAVITAVSKFIMEQGYGCEVTKVPSSTLPAVTSVAETGKPDIIAELWVNSAPVYEKLEAEGKVTTLTNVLSDGGVEAWFIPAYLAEAHPELTTLDGVMSNPELVGGKFHNCPTGWGCRVINDNLKQAFAIEKSVEVFDHGSGETLAASIAAAYTDKKPWFGYYWAPTAVLGKYPMVQVDIGPYNAEAHECNKKAECTTPGKSAYPSSRVITAATTDFAKRQPAIAELMKNVAFTNAQMGELLAWKEDNNASADEAAVYFLTNYKDTWAGWINDGAKEKLAAILK